MIKFIKKIIFENFFLKALSFFVAFLLWLNVTSEHTTTIDFVSYVDVINLPSKYEVEALYPERVVVILEGSKNILNELNPSDVYVYVDAKNVKIGENIFPVKVSLNYKKNLKILSIKPPQVKLYIRKK